MTQTSVASVWEPDLADVSLPSGLPWTRPDETPISDASWDVLIIHRPRGVLFEEPWMPQPQERLTGRLFVSAGAMAHQRVRLLRVANGFAFTSIEPVESDEAGVVHDLITWMKERLRLAWDPLLEALGYPRRTFFTHKKERTLPDSPQLGFAVRTLAWITQEDPTAARIMVEGHSAEIGRLASEGEFGAIRKLFQRTRRSLTPEAEAAPAPSSIVASNLEAVRQLTEEPGFAVAAQAIEGYAQHGNALDRVLATIDLETALREAKEGEALEPTWDFLPALTFAAIDAVRARAQAYLDSDEFSPDGWREFIAHESEGAWAAYNPVVLPLDPVEPAPATPAGSRRYRRPTLADRLSR